MSRKAVTPISELNRRLPRAGRLRCGKKHPERGYPVALDHWRFTSSDEEAIRQVAEVYGGEARPWENAPDDGKWEVFTNANEIRILLPPDPLGNTPIYKLWSGGGCQRRCDGETVETIERTGPDDVEYVDKPCICAANELLECKPTTWLSVILPDVKFAGAWQLKSSSWNAAQELPQMVSHIHTLQGRGIARGLLALEHRSTKEAGETHRYIVPVLRIDGTVDELIAGKARVGAMAEVGQGVDRPELEPGLVPTDNDAGEQIARDYPDSREAKLADGPPPDDEDIVDAEIVDEPEPPPPDDKPSTKRRAMQRAFHATLHDLGLDYADEVRPWLEDNYGETLSELPDEKLQGILNRLDAEGGKASFVASVTGGE